MGVDKSYGSGYKNTGMKKPVAPKAASAKLRRKGGNVAAKKYTSITTSKAKMLPGTSDYVTQENAARKQLGVAGLAARTRQLPTAARAFTKEMTGIDISRKGVSVDPVGLAMAVSPFKLLKAGKGLRATASLLGKSATKNRLLKQAGQVAYSLDAKNFGRAAAKKIAQSASTPKMGQQAAQDLYESTTDFVRSGKLAKDMARSYLQGSYPTSISSSVFKNARLGAANAGRKIKGSIRTIEKAVPKKAVPKKFDIRTAPAGKKGSAPYMEKLINPLVKPMTAGEKYRAGLAGKSTRVTELENRLSLPKKPKSPKNKPEPYTRDDKLNDYFAGYPTRKPRNRGGR
jgi:hypothetical protein